MRRAIAVFGIVFILIFGVLGFAAADGTNLLKNGSFESTTDSAVPENWHTNAYRNQAGYSRMAVTDEIAHSGQKCILIENASSNDARFITTVKVKPETLYRLSGYVLVDSMQETGNGANFAVEGIYAFSDGLFDTGKQWQYLEWYGETGEKQTEVTIGIRVGGYSAESVGKAYFDDIVLEQVDALPKGVVASLWYNPNATAAAKKSEDNGPEKNTFLIIAAAAAFLLLSFAATHFLEKQSRHFIAYAAFAVFALLALILRIVLGMTVEGYEVDINCFTAWSLRMARRGPSQFYAPDYFCDYPPGAMLLLWPIGCMLNAVGLQNEMASLLIVKLLPIMCDIAGAVCIYLYAQKKMGAFAGSVVSALYLFNPAALINSACWGQMDSVLALLILLTTILAMDRKLQAAIPMFAVSVLVKPQALLFAPIGGIFFLIHVFTCGKDAQQKVLLQALRGLGIALGCVLLIIVPFAIGQEKPVSWLLSLYGQTLGSYAYATLNTANLYYLADANWTALTQQPHALLFVIPAALFITITVLLSRKRSAHSLCEHTGKAKALSLMLAAGAASMLVMFVLDVDYNWYGYAMMAFAFLWAIVCQLYDQRPQALPYFMAMALIGVYVLGIKMHERYLFPALLLLLIAFVNTRDKRVLGVFVGFSATTFVNTAIVLDNSILFGASQGHLNSDTLLLNYLLCLANLMLFGYSFWIGMSGLRASKVKETREKSSVSDASSRFSSYLQQLISPCDHRLHLNARDFLIMAVTTILYAGLAFSNLGSMAAPQTAWVSTSDEESVVLKLDKPSTFSVLYYAGVSYHDFRIAVSDDCVNWSESYPCEMREGLCYRWNYALKATTSGEKVTYPSSNSSNVLWLNGQYLRIDACEAGLNLWEIVARDADGNNLPLQITEHTAAQAHLLNDEKPAANLIDEQNTCMGEPGWYTGTYFDEIYHARTAYEHLHGQAPYETTHPPLGKLLMSVGISIFGMTPFGWRFAGALIGVLMLPVIYLLAMQLTHKRSIAAVSILALTFDLMHFTQTRIATIDSFPVFFIMLTYLFMIRYMQMDSFEVSDYSMPTLLDRAYLKTLLPLLFCGICMGLSIASKWIGIYSALGLAILFFWNVYRQVRIWDVAWKTTDEENIRIQAARKFTIQRIGITCGFCIIFFIMIPCLIYGLSYIPYLAPTGPVTLKRIIRAQQGMLNYHSTPGLGMDHPFQSPWWQWPFILKPMWFAQDGFEPAGYASTILCFGNPWVFYIGAVAMAAVLLWAVLRYVHAEKWKLRIRSGDGELTYAILAIAFLAQYLPWVLVPRSMYIYHYFASVPFIILATALLLDKITAHKPILHKAVTLLYVVGAIVFFVMFFPYASGYLTNTDWLDAMKWFSKLYY